MALARVADRTRRRKNQHRLFKSGLDQLAEVGAYSSDEVVATILTALDHRVSVVELLDAWALAFEPDSAVLRHVTSLVVPCALFTNNEPMLDACLTTPPLQFLSVGFNDIICSWQIHAMKPAVAAFERIAEPPHKPRLASRPPSPSGSTRSSSEPDRGSGMIPT